MVKITYIDPQGTARSVDAEEGSTVMEMPSATAYPESRPSAAEPAPARPATSMSRRNGARRPGGLSPWKRTCWTSPSMSVRIRACPPDSREAGTRRARGPHPITAGMRPAAESRSRNVGEQPSGFDPARYPAGTTRPVGRRPSPVRVPDREAPGTPVERRRRDQRPDRENEGRVLDPQAPEQDRIATAAI